MVLAGAPAISGLNPELLSQGHSRGYWRTAGPDWHLAADASSLLYSSLHRAADNMAAGLHQGGQVRGRERAWRLPTLTALPVFLLHREAGLAEWWNDLFKF